MTEQQLRVRFQPHGRAVFVLPGTTVLEAAARAGLTIDTPCGGEGTCGKCRVRITSGAGEPAPAEKKVFSGNELADGWRLACQTSVSAETVIQVPESSLFGSGHKILTETLEAGAAEIIPAVRKVYLELPTPSLADDAPDLIRLSRQLGEFDAGLEMIRRLGRLLRDNDFKGTAVLADKRLINFEPGDTTELCYGAAFDVGTTTVVGALLDLCTGEELATAARMNPQISFGDDVLSRIKHSSSSAEAAEQMRRLITQAVNEMLAEMSAQADIPAGHIYELTFAGNTTMEHLLCGLEVAQLGQVPFVPAYGRGLAVGAGEAGIAIHDRGAVYVFPVIGGFVGGDTVAGLLATELAGREGAAMMVDIGTNGEIVLARDGQLSATSTAAGPAFEGARISCGMRAAPGAIEKIVLDGDVRFSVIGDSEPAGLCGSALVDLAAELLRCGIVTPTGRLLRPDELPQRLSPQLRRRVSVDSDNQTEFLIAGGESGGPKPQPRVALTQRDVREMQLAAGAIRAGISILLRQAGLASGDLECIFLAGGFGSFIRRSNAQRIGLLPGGIDHSRIHYVGNTSLNGAKWALLSTEARSRAEQLARQTRHVELSQDPQFQNEFAEAMIFPSGD